MLDEHCAILPVVVHRSAVNLLWKGVIDQERCCVEKLLCLCSFCVVDNSVLDQSMDRK